MERGAPTHSAPATCSTITFLPHFRPLYLEDVDKLLGLSDPLYDPSSSGAALEPLPHEQPGSPDAAVIRQTAAPGRQITTTPLSAVDPLATAAITSPPFPIPTDEPSAVVASSSPPLPNISSSFTGTLPPAGPSQILGKRPFEQRPPISTPPSAPPTPKRQRLVSTSAPVLPTSAVTTDSPQYKADRASAALKRKVQQKDKGQYYVAPSAPPAMSSSSSTSSDSHQGPPRSKLVAKKTTRGTKLMQDAISAGGLAQTTTRAPAPAPAPFDVPSSTPPIPRKCPPMLHFANITYPFLNGEQLTAAMHAVNFPQYHQAKKDSGAHRSTRELVSNYNKAYIWHRYHKANVREAAPPFPGDVLPAELGE